MKKSISITLDIAEIIFDIQNKTYLTGRSRSDALSHERVAAMQANDDEENLDQVRRSVSTALAHLKTRVGEYLTVDATSARNSLQEAAGSVVLLLAMPSNYNTASLEAIAAAAHDFIVARAVADWFVITDKSDASDYAEAAERALSALDVALCRRVRPRRPAAS